MTLSFFFIPNVQQDEQTFQVKLLKKSTSTNFSRITIILCFNDTSENARAALFYTYLVKTSGNMDKLTSNTQKQKQILENTNIQVFEETGSKQRYLHWESSLKTVLYKTSYMSVSVNSLHFVHVLIIFKLGYL